MRLLLWLVRHGETVANKDRILQGQMDGALSSVGFQQAKDLGIALKDVKFKAALCSDLKRAKQTADECISQLNHQPEVICCRDARERCCGVMEGRSVSMLIAAAEEAKCAVKDFVPEGAETYGDVRQRARKVMQLVCKQADQKVSGMEENVRSTLLNSTENRENGSSNIEYTDVESAATTAPTISSNSSNKIERHLSTMVTNILLISHGGFIRETLAMLMKENSMKLADRNDVGKLGRVSPNTGVTILDITFNEQEIESVNCLLMYAQASDIFK